MTEKIEKKKKMYELCFRSQSPYQLFLEVSMCVLKLNEGQKASWANDISLQQYLD